MSLLLFETVKCEDGKLHNMKFHQARFDLARKNCFSISDKIDLHMSVKIPQEYQVGLFRCRIIYSKKIEKVEFLPHQYIDVKSLKLIWDDTIDYQFKYSDRTKLNALYEKRENCDDILIVKNDCITDSLTANPIFFDGEKWWSPDTPLLAGTQRAKLISESKIFVCRINLNDLSKYRKVGLINALQDITMMPVIDTHAIVY